MADLEFNVTVHVRFYDGDHECSFAGGNDAVYLCHRDIFEDDYPGYSYLNDNVEGPVFFDTGANKSIDSSLENYPDFYYRLMQEWPNPVSNQHCQGFGYRAV